MNIWLMQLAVGFTASLLPHLVEHLRVLLGGDKGDGKTLGAKTASTANTMQVCVSTVALLLQGETQEKSTRMHFREEQIYLESRPCWDIKSCRGTTNAYCTANNSRPCYTGLHYWI